MKRIFLIILIMLLLISCRKEEIVEDFKGKYEFVDIRMDGESLSPEEFTVLEKYPIYLEVDANGKGFLHYLNERINIEFKEGNLFIQGDDMDYELKKNQLIIFGEGLEIEFKK